MKECPSCQHCFPDHVNHCPYDGNATTPSLPGDGILEGRYQLEKRLGHGGMGLIFKARDISLNTTHAVKFILPDLLNNDPLLVTRFRREALAMAAARHQNIIAVSDFGVLRGVMVFFVMEFVQGKSLYDILAAEGALPPSRAVEIIEAVGAGVAAAHSAGVLHLDLKPLNIIIQDNLPISEAVKILDFGLAKIKSGELLGSFIRAHRDEVMGTPFYMAPEIWGGEEPDAHADIYSIGVILYEMLGGDVPFKGSSFLSIMKKHLIAAPPPFSSLGVQISPMLEAVVFHALEKDADNRPQTVEILIDELRDAMAAADTSGEQNLRSIIKSHDETGHPLMKEDQPTLLANARFAAITAGTTPRTTAGRNLEAGRLSAQANRLLLLSLRIFLCHASTDKPVVRELYERLRQNGFAPWLDEEDLLPGQDWHREITKAVRNSEVVIVCLSNSSINKSGYVQKEIKFALDVADERPEDTIFIIPLKLEPCDLPDRLSRWQCVSYFEEKGYLRLIKALKRCVNSL